MKSAPYTCPQEPFCILPLHDLCIAAKRDITIAAVQADALRGLFNTNIAQ